MTKSSWALETHEYLEALFDSERADWMIEIRCPQYPRLRTFFHTWGADSPASYIRRFAEIADIYVGVAPRIRTAGKQTGGKSAIDRVQALWADCDTGSSIEKLVDFVPTPTMEVSSGGGVHAYWILEADVSKEQAEVGNRRLALALGADSAATDAARVLRPPGTFNHKPNRLIDGDPAPVTLLALREARYAWNVIVGALPDPPRRASMPNARTAGRRGDDPLFRIPPPVYVERLSGRTVGPDGKALCPFHPDVNPSLHAYPDPEGGWWCYGCNRGGGIIQFGALLFGIEPHGAEYHRLRREIAARVLGRAA